MSSGDELPVRWAMRGIEALVRCNVSWVETEQAVAEPEFVVTGISPRIILVLRHDDAARQRPS